VAVTVGAYEAKTKLSELLDRVARGESITITKHGVPVATLRPAEGQARSASDLVSELRRLRQGVQLDGLPIRDMIDEARR
jgi:prevent-host-death family protein